MPDFLAAENRKNPLKIWPAWSRPLKSDLVNFDFGDKLFCLESLKQNDPGLPKIGACSFSFVFRHQMLCFHSEKA